MSQESLGEDEIRFRYLEQHFYMLLFLLTLTVVPQAMRKDDNLPRLLAIVVGTPVACFAISWLSSRGRWLSKSEDADDPRYSHFLDLGGFMSMYALIVWFFFSSSAVIWALKGPVNCARPWMAALAMIALAGLVIAGFVAVWTLILTRVRRLAIGEMRKPTRYSFNIAMGIAIAAMGFFVVSALVTQIDFIDSIWRTRCG
ncbi:MAG: hypothetical protein OEV36_04550 [Myxococcales bacterium]|jgi:hypothetical protein|nr:hypothetical protein [Myxococcales bacterium]